MPPGIVDGYLRGLPPDARILDPMCGSGSTLKAAISRDEFRAIGYDSDPLAVLISRVSLRHLAAENLAAAGNRVMARARERLSSSDFDWSMRFDEGEREYIKFWFDWHNRRQLGAIAAAISGLKDRRMMDALWVAFSRMIIVKSDGVSLGMDIAHSRPHKAYNWAPRRAFDAFPDAVAAVGKALELVKPNVASRSEVRQGDARSLRIRSGSVDLAITSPPYLNAIDYLRGHRLSLIWMGHSLREIKSLRTSNIGTERSDVVYRPEWEQSTRQIARRALSGAHVPARLEGIVLRYVNDMEAVMGSVARALTERGRAVLVTGDSRLQGYQVSTAKIIRACAEDQGLRHVKTRRRVLAEAHRYLPPPTRRRRGGLEKRMKYESISSFTKP